MRELTSLETGYLAAGLALSLVLPLLMSLHGPLGEARRSAMKLVWTGQALLAFAGLIVLLSPLFAPYAAAFALVSCIACAVELRRRFRLALNR